MTEIQNNLGWLGHLRHARATNVLAYHSQLFQDLLLLAERAERIRTILRIIIPMKGFISSKCVHTGLEHGQFSTTDRQKFSADQSRKPIVKSYCSEK